MLKRRNQLIASLFIFSDLIVTYISLLLAYYLRFHLPTLKALFEIQHIPPLSDFIKWGYMASIGIIWMIVFHFNGLYKAKRGHSMIDEVFSIISSVILSTIILLGIIFFYRKPSYDISRSLIIIFFFLDILFVSAFRVSLRSFLRSLRKKGFNQRNVLVVGAGELGVTFLRILKKHTYLGLQVIGFIDDDETKIGKEIDGVKVLGNLDQTSAIIEELLPDQLYIALPHWAHKRTVQILASVQKECIAIKLIPDLLGYVTLKASVEDLDGLPIINISESPFDGWNGMLKRLMDVILSIVGIIVTLPLSLIISLLIKLTSRGPVFYQQERMGVDGKPFMIYKFRSMVSDAEEKTGPTFAQKNDPRITTIGSFLRRYSIDELPQLLNVLKGDMSLVGPRPERPLFVKQFRDQIPQYMLRHKVKAGMTGWAQIHGLRGSSTSMEKRVEYDIYYIKNWSLKLDVIILLLTLIKFRRLIENAY
ncbi:undecaprenyl-phosphate glucose phosphotransferase [candidate division CSSED10-310 bacterium]|uniref:Undecaprenyl-phosphate glucose phosphotransferase n=1 Tax=candidate division CSSED10-310 bacterium TaxID=2855610 RepID=A0ABV6YWQ1_UNCC1